jgi:membrane-associated protease RseP (regulator of RpoE activity)
LGHLLTARYYGIKVLALPAFGPELISLIDRFGTTWKLRAFPKTIEKTILRILGSCTFLHMG